MLKRWQYIDELIESDFRKIQEILRIKYGKAFSLDYIRKVCKGKRHNKQIRNLARQYIKVLNEMEIRFQELTETDDGIPERYQKYTQRSRTK